MLNTKPGRINIILFCILILAFILRIIYLGSKSLWLDEAVNVMMAEKSIFSWDNSLPPLYFAILHLWLSIGKSEASVRFLSVIFGVLSVFAIYNIGIILYGEKEALVSAFLLSISQTAIIFSQNAIYYSIFFPLSVVSVYFFLRMEQKPTNSNKVLFLISIVLTFYAHYFTILLLLVFIIFKIWKYKYDNANLKEIKSFFLIIGVFFLLIGPIFTLFISQTVGKAGYSYIDFEYQTHLSIAFMKDIFTYLIVNEISVDKSVLPGIISVLFLYGLVASFKTDKKSIIFLLMWLFLPIVFAAVLTNIIFNLHIRYISFVLPALLLISSHGIVAIPEKVNSLMKNRDESTKLRISLIILIIIFISLLSYPNLNFYYSSNNYDWRGAAAYIEKNAEDGSNIVLAPSYNSIPFNYYYKSNGKNVLEYSSLDELIKITPLNNTYLIATNDILALNPDELSKLLIWIDIITESKAILSGPIEIFKNRTLDNIAYVNDIEILLLGSSPVQVNVVARGEFANNCTEIATVKKKLENNIFLVAVYTSQLTDEVCAQTRTPFEKVIELDTEGVKPGNYIVIVNGVSSAFELETDNIFVK